MGATITEALMAMGDWSIDLDYRADIADQLRQKCHVLVYNPAGAHVYTGVLLRKSADQSGITIGGRDIGWWLGLDDTGPLIADREYISGKNKLSNGDFRLVDLYWSRDDGSQWSVSAAQLARVLADRSTSGDDVLRSDESFPARAGHSYNLAASVYRLGGATGRLRLRTVYEGLFAHPNLLPDAWTNPSTTPGDAAVLGPGSLRIGPTTRLEPNINGGFENGLTSWTADEGTWATTTADKVSGTNSVTTTVNTGQGKVLRSDPAIAVQPKEKWHFEGWTKASSTPTGPQGDGGLECVIDTSSIPNPSIHEKRGCRFTTDAAKEPERDRWRFEQADFEIPDDGLALIPQCYVWGHITQGSWYWDAIRLYRILGNRASLRSSIFTVTPERPYLFQAKVTTAAGWQSGHLRLQVELVDSSAARPTVIMESQALEVASAGQVIQFAFTPPSGYDRAYGIFEGTDVIGGSYTVSEFSVVDADPSTKVHDLIVATPQDTSLAVQFTTAAVVGAERVRTEVVAEYPGDGWVVDNVALTRVATTSTHAQVVTGLLADPDTGQPMSVIPGVLTGATVIPYDWHIINRTVRDALHHFCSIVAEPPMEWRINYPTRTLDAGPATTVFTDHSVTSAAPVLILPGDVDVLDAPDIEENGEDIADKIVLIGAERRGRDGRTTVVSATAVAPTTDVDWNGKPPNRTRVVADGTVDHAGYAAALAADLVAKNLRPAEILTLALAGEDRAFGVGDWIYIYKPEAGLSDPANATWVDGEPVFPKRERVLGRTRMLTPAWRVALRRMDGTVLDPLPGIRWEPAAGSTIEVGDRPPEFAADPQGGAVGMQYLRDRVSSPRR